MELNFKWYLKNATGLSAWISEGFVPGDWDSRNQGIVTVVENNCSWRKLYDTFRLQSTLFLGGNEIYAEADLIFRTRVVENASPFTDQISRMSGELGETEVWLSYCLKKDSASRLRLSFWRVLQSQYYWLAPLKATRLSLSDSLLVTSLLSTAELPNLFGPKPQWSLNCDAQWTRIVKLIIQVTAQQPCNTSTKLHLFSIHYTVYSQL